MVDPVTTVGAGAVVAYLSKDGLNKLLGPTADYLGGRVKGLVEKCDVNLARVFEKAHKKLGERINESGVVSPRIVKQIVDEARFCEDEIASEYFGGVLASSRSNNKRDDRGLHYLGTLKQLSVYEIRLHYIFYSLLRKSYPDPLHQINLSQKKRLENMYCRILFPDLAKSMDFSTSEDAGVITLHAIEALKKHDLLLNTSKFRLPHSESDLENAKLHLAPSLFGIIFYIWANGYADVSPTYFFGDELNFQEVPTVILPDQKNVDIHQSTRKYLQGNYLKSNKAN